ncbi:MAG: zinc ribbon domain-containing protein [Lachnospiraceae bacterium]|nr:zinc ribbon domain-containing protein [Lachnospiraceae bacterium]MBD5395634.1 zinc ribbon domain-containing protein [Lachnospiraceae bacterium]
MEMKGVDEMIGATIALTEYDDLNKRIKLAMRRSADDVVQLGFLLRQMMEQQKWTVYYSSFDEYLNEELHMEYSRASRFIKINKKYSDPENGLNISPEYKDYSEGLLIEMLSMSPELEAKVTPDMTVKQAREIKRQARAEKEDEDIPGQTSIETDFKELLPDQEEQKNIKMKPDVRGLIDHAYCAQCGTPLDEDRRSERCPECGQMQDWNWYEEIYGDHDELPEADAVIDGEYREIEEAEEVATSQTESAHDEAWFVNQYINMYPDEVRELYEICLKEANNSDRAKAVQKYIAPYGHHSCSCSEYEFSFYGFGGGIRFRIGQEEIRLKYGHFVKELMKIFDTEKCPHEELSAYGLPKTEYPEGSLITTKGCGHKYSCFSCAQECRIRQEDNYCVEAPLGSPFGCTTMKVLENLKTEMGNKCQFTNHDLADSAAGSGAPQPCCKKCQEPCGYRCQRSQQSAISKEDPEEENEEVITDDLSITKFILKREEKTLNDFLEVGGLPEMTVLRQKTIVAALDARVCDLETSDQEEPIQPDLPILKNNDQREEWLNNYKTWGLWYYDEHIDVNYYKYDFEDGSRLVVAEYPQRQYWWKKNKVEDEHYYHLLQVGKKGDRFTYNEKFRNTTDSKTYLVEFLKDLQKKGK